MSKVAKKTTRPRGGATLTCPRCGGVTRVLRTTRIEKIVVRRRQCIRRRCGQVFDTREEAA